jgi:hypothetical protein
LSSVAELSNVLTAENLGEVLPRYFHLSRSEAKEVTAELKPDPAPPLRTVITPVLAPPRTTCTVDGGFPGNLLDANSAVPGVVPPPVVQRPKRADVEPLNGELRRVHVTVSRSLVEKLALARDALSHSRPRASDDAIVWRAVWERDGGCCAWPLENGGVCGSTYKLELDHREGFALGAGTTIDETRLVCRSPPPPRRGAGPPAGRRRPAPRAARPLPV